MKDDAKPAVLDTVRAVVGCGVSIGQLLTGTIPAPTHRLNWGENIPADIMTALRKGETAMLHDPDGAPYSLVLMDYYGQIRERRVSASNAALSGGEAVRSKGLVGTQVEEKTTEVEV